MQVKQDEVWFCGEGDAWFNRNRKRLGKNPDIILTPLELYKIKPKRVVEIGCSNGHRLARLHEKYGCEVIGIEPSIEAIKNGQKKWPFIHFIRGMGEDFKLNLKADLVIINFVFHWVSRDRLLRFVANTDNILKSGGYLLIGDFGNENYIRRAYHHLPGKNLFTYKQAYQDMFIASGTYKEITKLTFNYDTLKLSADIGHLNTGTVSLLKKMESYIETK